MKSCLNFRIRFVARVLVILTLMLTGFSVKSNSQSFDTQYLLVLNSYTTDAPWSSSIIESVLKRFSVEDSVDVFVEHLNSLTVNDADQLSFFVKDVFEHHAKRPPRAVLMLGNTSLLLLKDVKDRWGDDLPVVLCGEDDYFVSNNAYLEKHAVEPSKHIPIKKLCEESNLTLIKASYFLKETVGLMYSMIPQMNRLIFIGDGRFLNQQLDYELQHYLQQYYPDLDYSFYSSRNMSVDSLMRNLQQVDRHRTGILFSSWFSRHLYSGNKVFMASSFHVIANVSAPVFALGNAVLTRGNMIGGYMYDQKLYNEQVLLVLDQVFLGVAPRDIPFYTPIGKPMFNYPAILQKGFHGDDCPSDSVFYNRPRGFIERYLIFIVLTGVPLLLLVFFIILYQRFRIKSLKDLQSAQQKENESNAELAALFDNMPVAYVKERLIRNDEGEIVDAEICMVNRQFKNMVRSDVSLLGARTNRLYGEDSALFVRSLQLLEKEKTPMLYSYFVKELDMHIDVVQLLSVQQDCVDVFCIDSSELYRAQMKLDSINRKLSMTLEVANIISWRWVLAEGRIYFDINQSVGAEAGFSTTREERYITMDSDYHQRVHVEDRERLTQLYQELVSGKRVRMKVEYRLFETKECKGQYEWYEVQAAVLDRNEDGEAVVLIGSSLFITERKELEENLLQAKNKAEESNRLKSAFLTNMSHEIRTPLNAIVGFSGLLPSVEEPDEQREYISIIENNNTLLLQLIGDILDLSKIESGTLEFVDTDFDLNQLLSEMETSMQMRVKSGQVSLVYEGPRSEFFITSERNRLSQVLINLLTNAAKFTTEGFIRFGYAIQEDRLHFYVSDTGCGIPAEKLSAVFERFVKLNNFVQGTGLGLSICQTIVEHMGGEITVESESGKGAIFRFVLPYCPIGRLFVEPKDRNVLPATKRLTILIAEDNISNFRLFDTILRNDYYLLHAWNGQEAVEQFKEMRPDIVLMDLNMPIMDGYEATRAIRLLDPLVPIVAVTAFAYTSDEQRVLKSGFDGYVAKPIQAHRLKDKLIEIVQSRLILL